MLKKLESEIEFLENVKKKCKTIIENAPDGKLRCAINKGCYQYYSGKEYLGESKKEYIKQIAVKEYATKLSEKTDQYLRKLQELQELYKDNILEEVYRKLHPGRKNLIEPLVKPIEDIIKEFENIKYAGKEFAEDDETEYFTMKGERVRSKSEKIIADELFRCDIPYKYEMPIELQDRYKRVTLYPDFTVLNKRTGRKWFLEHLGMMDRLTYFENTMRKWELYERNGILIGKNIIFSHETLTQPLNIKTLKVYIENYLM